MSDNDEAKNQLSPIANKYPQLLVPAKAGDVVFFNGHVLHRSARPTSPPTVSAAHSVSHYCNARSFTQWGPITHGPNAPKQDPVTLDIAAPQYSRAR